jgi:hypothetical protein
MKGHKQWRTRRELTGSSAERKKQRRKQTSFKKGQKVNSQRKQAKHMEGHEEHYLNVAFNQGRP